LDNKLTGEDRLIVIAGTESMEWYPTNQTHGLHLFDAIPFTQFQPLL
jgi:hypothetical protein